uniref:UDENN FNIP1/2-type domain-containing protein n=1 Tax=Caenorhabditis tropicalis TaxID=1561998 RepID=A0A1I7TQ60_9PELO
MASYVRQFFTAKRRRTDSSSEDSVDQHRPTSTASSNQPSSSSSFLSPSSTTSMDHLYGIAGGGAPGGRMTLPTTSRGGNTGLQVTGSGGHRRQHSSPGHLQLFQQENSSRNAANLARIARRRQKTEAEYDPNERPPKFTNRIGFYQSENHLDQHDMRMILIEAESRVLYDTATVIPTRYGVQPNVKSHSPCGQFQFLKRLKDTQKLSQMLFGAVPNLKANESFRIHFLEDEEMILVSKTFAIPKYKKGFPKKPKEPVSSPDDDNQNTIKSLDGWKPRKTKSIMTTPEGFSRVRHVSITFGEEGAETDSSSQNQGSPASSSFSLPRAFSPPHRISKTRRRQMAVRTSLSETSGLAASSKARSRMSSMCSSQTEEDSLQILSMRNVALGILVPMKHRYFLMQHIPLVEMEMSRMEMRVVNAAGHPATFLHNISKSWEELTEVVCQLHNAPRLKHPYWLALNEKCHIDGRTLAMEFCSHLAFLVRRYDRKEAGYFLSNLVTAVLMHHMSWVASVATPPLGNIDRYQNAHNHMLFGMSASEAAPTVGYNALMAQYLEITGACGMVRSAKVCILGDDMDILASLINVLSFFIRCSAVHHVDDDKMWEVPTEQPFSPVDVSGSPSTLPGCSHVHQNANNLLKIAHHKNAGGYHPEETSSVAMMRRLRNNNLAAIEDSGPSTSAETAAINAAMAADEAALEASTSSQQPFSSSQQPSTSSQASSSSQQPSSSSQHSSSFQQPSSSSQPQQAVAIIDRTDFPCCPTIGDDKDMWSPRRNPDGLGRSMFAGPLLNYCPHFVLSATLKNNANMPDVYARMFDEVRCVDYPHLSSSTAIHHHSLSSNSQSNSSICDPMIPENVLIVADIDHLTVKVLSSEGSDEVTSPSESVVGMLEQFVGYHDAIPATAEFLVGIIEDCLAHVVGKSLTLVELVRSGDQPQKALPAPPVIPAITASSGPPSPSSSSSMQLTPDTVRAIIDCDHSDLRLIVNVASVYWPPVLQSVLG